MRPLPHDYTGDPSVIMPDRHLNSRLKYTRPYNGLINETGRVSHKYKVRR